MGRGAGDIALNTAIASGASAVVIPEVAHNDDDICAKINESRKTGKRNFIVIVSEGVGSDYAPALAKKIEEKTGVETKFARFAHIVRGGNPTIKDRVMASQMGVAAVMELLKGNSNLVICEKDGQIVARDINYALKLDRMYKGKLKDGDLDSFDEATIQEMKNEIYAKRAAIKVLHDISNKINL